MIWPVLGHPKLNAFILGLFAVGCLVLTTFLVGGPAEANPPKGLQDYIRVFEMEVHGDTVSCVAFGLGGTNQTASITCDWEHPR